MKKLALLFISLIMLLSLSICTSAVDVQDGLYEVPVILMHKEDEKESFGNKYVAQVGLLEIKDGKRTITIFLTTDMDGIEFSYYTNGSLSGDVADCSSVSNVTVAGDTYKQGFEIPVMKSGDLGLKFSVPVMPMSPSARLRIDYDSARLIELYDAEAEIQITEVNTDEFTTQDEIADITEEAPNEEISTETKKEEATAESTTESEIFEETTTETNEEQEKSGDNRESPVIYALVLVAVVVTVLMLGKKLGRAQNDDK